MSSIGGGTLKLTEKQQEILDIVKQFIKTNGYSPTFREIASLYGSSIKGAYDHCIALKKKKRLDWNYGDARTIREVTH